MLLLRRGWAVASTRRGRGAEALQGIQQPQPQESGEHISLPCSEERRAGEGRDVECTVAG